MRAADADDTADTAHQQRHRQRSELTDGKSGPGMTSALNREK